MQGQDELAGYIKRTIEIWHLIYREGDIFFTVAALWQDVASLALVTILPDYSNAVLVNLWLKRGVI